jgi:HlyD family secretion protein
MRKIKIIIWIITVGAFGAVGWYFFLRKEKEIISWKTATIQKGDITTIVTATGSLNALITVQVGTQVSGTIAKLLVDYNAVVKKGQVIAILDTTFLVASRNEAEANLDKAMVQMNQYVREFDRVKKLFNERVSTQMEYDQALTNHELGKSNVKSALAQLQRAKINLRYATIRAPISGVVISRNVDVGQTVISSFNAPTLFTIANDLTRMEVQANIDEADIGQIRVDEAVTFTVDAYPNALFKGRVKQVRLQPVTVQNVVNYVVTIDVPNRELKLLPGLTANIDVIVDEGKGVLKVPMAALQFNPPVEYSGRQQLNDKRVSNEISKFEIHQPFQEALEPAGTLWLLEGDSLHATQVVTGISDGTYIAVAGAVAEGDVVVTGINNKAVATSTTQSPFMPKMPTRRRSQ